MKIDWQELDPETLDRLLQEVVTRDGTDYGAVERTTSSKVATARKALTAGRAELHWDIEAESAALLTPEEAAERAAKARQQNRSANATTDAAAATDTLSEVRPDNVQSE